MKILFGLRPADSLTILFILFLMCITLVFHEKIPRLPVLVLIYALLFLTQILLLRNYGAPAGNRLALELMRSIGFPVVCILVIFDSLELLVHNINPNDIDPLLIRLDYLIFKGYPTVMLEAIHNPVLTDILQLSYTSYYFLPLVLGVLLKLRKREAEFDRTVFLILFCFYLSYVGYMLFPALGPRYTMNHLQSFELNGLLIAEPVQELLNSIEGIKRDAFPSGHTAVALVVLGLAHRYHRVFFITALPVVTLLIFSTVYCRYHYVVDVIGGIILAAITFFIGDRYYGYWEIRNNTSS